MALERRHIVYEGRVQGVGFRFTSSRLASDFEVSGFVRNLPDGSVELEVQGDLDQVRDFLSSIRAALGTKIHRAVETPIPHEPGLIPGDFRIVD